MKTICIALLALVTLVGPPNKPIEKVDLKRFGGTWYSLSSIPTMFDKGSRETTTHYNWSSSDGYYSVVTTCKEESGKIKTVKSKIIPVKDGVEGEMKAQFIWPIKVDYWVVDLAPDYSWAVVGHPDHRFLFIMSRKPSLDKKLFGEIVERCKEMGYPVDKLVSQKFPGE